MRGRIPLKTKKTGGARNAAFVFMVDFVVQIFTPKALDHSAQGWPIMRRTLG
jgi:hypothetical protein